MPSKKSKAKQKKRDRQAGMSEASSATASRSAACSATQPSSLQVSQHLLSAVTKVVSLVIPPHPAPSDLELGLTEDELPYALEALRGKYQALGKGEWWWIFDDTIYHFVGLLRQQSYAVIDGFFSTPDGPQQRCTRTTDLKREIQQRWMDGLLAERGAVINGTDGVNTSQTREEIRGDYIGWFKCNKEEGWASYDQSSSLPGYLIKLSTLLTEMQKYLPEELGGIVNRSRAMVTCYPPGTRYTRHVDNGGLMSNGRRLTALLYLNDSWAPVRAMNCLPFLSALLLLVAV